MSQSILITAAALLALQSVPATSPSEAEGVGSGETITDLSQLPPEQAAGPRCGVAFAIIEGAQAAGDKAAEKWPDLKANGAMEFFVRSIAKLMDDYGLERAAAQAVVMREVEGLSRNGNEKANQMMPACLLMKQSAGL